jgi:hypothetical protein
MNFDFRLSGCVAAVAVLWLAAWDPLGGGEVAQPDVAQYSVLKGQFFQQTSTATPTAPATSGVVFQAAVLGSATDSVLSATLDLPGGSNRVLIADGLGAFFFEDFRNNRATLDSIYTTGTYTFLIETLNDGTNETALVLPNNSYPVTPRLTNWVAAQLLDASADFTFVWNSFTGAGSNDFISLSILDGMSNEVFHSGAFGSPGALTGANRSVTIPAGSLETDQQYRGELLFLRVSNLDTNTLPGATGWIGLFSETAFSISTDTNYSNLALLTTNLPDAEINLPYAATFVVTGGLPPYLFAVEGIFLPGTMVGLSLGTNGTLSGVPVRPYNPSPKTSRSKTARFTLLVADQAGAIVRQAYRLRIFEPVSIRTSRLRDGDTGKSYRARLKAINGSRPYLWSASNSLPPGLSLDAANGSITGMPQTNGVFTNVTIHVSDSLGGHAQRTFRLSID